MKDTKTKRYKNLLTESRHRVLKKVNKKYCTRETLTRKSILDHVATNIKDNQFHMITINSPLSDYKRIYLEKKNVKPP